MLADETEDVAAGPVDPSYRHYPKRVESLGARSASGAIVKLYHLAVADQPVAADVAASVEAWLAGGAGDLLDPGDRGFAIVHRCGADFHFVLLSLWREANELWEAVWACHGSAEVRPFPAAYPPVAGSPRPTFCVWELEIVAHEAGCWTRYLESDRDGAALAAWQADELRGPPQASVSASAS